MKRLLALTALTAVSFVLGNAATASVAPVRHVLASQSASGVFATATVSITTHNARPVVLVAAGTGQLLVSWDVGCSSATSYASHSGTFTGPATKVVFVPAGTSTCYVLASATVKGLAPRTVTVKIEQ